MPPASYVALHWSAGLGFDEKDALDLGQCAARGPGRSGTPAALSVALIRPVPETLDTTRPGRARREALQTTSACPLTTPSPAPPVTTSPGGSDQVVVSDGIRGQKGGINSPTTFNAGLSFVQFWDGRAPTLEAQAGGPPMNPVEMGSAGWPQIVEKLNKDTAFRKEFEAAYPEGFTEKTITHAIAEFERTLVTPNSRFDRYLKGDQAALAADEKHGYDVFVEKGCATCHVGELLGGKSYEVGPPRRLFHGSRGQLTDADNGRFNQTKAERDRHAFKVPTLRNVARTFPYFHDGSKKTLREAVDAMAIYQVGAPLVEKDAGT
jgi:cytochrome c peroxidase